MRLISSKNPEKSYLAYPSKGGVLPKWATPEKNKPKKIRVDGEFVEFYANQEKSDYIYFKKGDKVYAIHAKEKSTFDLLDETSVKVYVKPPKAEKPKKEKAPKAEKKAAKTESKSSAKSKKTPKVNKAAAGGGSDVGGESQTPEEGGGEGFAPEGDTGAA